MEQPCSRCGYISDRPARFCRQCGSQLFVENDATSATTRNYSQQATPQFAEQQSGYSGYAPGGWAEQATPNTSRFYQPPVVPQYEVPVAPAKSGWVKWVLISFAAFFLLSLFLAGGVVYWASKKVERAVEQAQQEGVVVEIPDVPAVPDVPFPPEAPAPAVAFTLDSFKYPGATVVTTARAPFTETVTLTTSDDLEKVKEFYDKMFTETFKDTNTQIKVEEGEKYVYTSLTHPMLTIQFEPDNSDPDKVKINLTRIKASIPNIKIPKEVFEKMK